MIKIAFSTLKLLRPRQWIKNIAIFAAIVFSGELFDWMSLQKALIAFFVFCILSSAIYVINDIFDIKKDRLHPFKRFRPLAHQDLSVPYAIAVSIVLIIISLVVSLMVTPAFFVLSIIYLLIQLYYSKKAG